MTLGVDGAGAKDLLLELEILSFFFRAGHLVIYVFVCPSNYIYFKPKVTFSTNSHSKELARKAEENQTAS